MSPTLLNVPIIEEERYFETKHGSEKQVLSSDTCCICAQRIWMTSRMQCSIFFEAFSMADARGYLDGTPNYLKNPSLLLRCHYDCKSELIKQFHNNTFIKR